jgi:hypothetical protein
MAINLRYRRQKLVEMATVCHRDDGFGFIGIINSKDHNPPHIRIYDLNGRDELGQIYLNSNIPQSIHDIETYKGDVDGVKRNIVKWANESNDGVNNWLHSFRLWNIYQKDQIK